MLFIEKIAHHAIEQGGNLRVSAVYIGLSYVVAVLENGNCGLGFVFKDDLPAGCSVSLPKRPLAGSTARELLQFAGQSYLCNSIALAVANGILTPLVSSWDTGDVVDHFQLEPGMKVGMIGHFRPLVPVIKKGGAELLIFDLHPEPFSGVQSANRIPQLLPQCDVALITATSIINQTIDELLVHAQGCKRVALLGPSTPLFAPCYTDMPISCAAGVTVTNPEGLIAAVIEAGGMGVFSRYINKVNIPLRAPARL